MRQEEKQEDCRPSVLCEAALPQAISSLYLSLCFSLHSSLHLRFKQKAGSLKGRIFNQNALAFRRTLPPSTSQHRDRETERGWVESERASAVWGDVYSMFLVSLSRMLKAAVGIEPLTSWLVGFSVNFRPSCSIIQHHFASKTCTQLSRRLLRLFIFVFACCKTLLILAVI